MKIFLALLFMAVGVIGGLYVGVWLCFIGGIVQFVTSITPVVIPMGIAYGIAKIFLAGLAGWLCVTVFCGIGLALLQE